VHLLASQSQTELKRYKRIGLFDSGLGGLSVLKSMVQLPDAHTRSFVYVGDTARCPYGNRGAAEIALFVEQIVKWLAREDVDAIVMACNTSAAMARKTAELASRLPVFDLIAPTSVHVANLPGNGNIGVMATVSTARSQAFSQAIRSNNPAANVFEYGCPELVPIVEGGTVSSDHCTNVLATYVEQFRRDQVNTVILGCTHFPFLRGQLEKLAGDQIKFVDPAQILTGTVSDELHSNYSCDLYVTGDPESFARCARTYLGDIPFGVRSIAVDQLEACRLESGIAMPSESVAASTIQTIV
jgi:glutamate racemase